MFKIAICDDDIKVLEILSNYINVRILQENLDIEIINLSNNYNTMIDFIGTSQADLYILDIDLKENDLNKNGYVLAQIIRKKSKTANIIFITGNQVGYLQKGYDVNAFHFYIKPFEYEHLYKTIISAYDLFKSIYKDKNLILDEYNTILNIISSNTLYRVHPKCIIFIEKIGISNKIKIKLNNGNILESKMTMLNFENLNIDYLIKTHKSFICNINYITSINFMIQEITMTDGSKCALGRTYKENIKKYLMQY